MYFKCDDDHDQIGFDNSSELGVFPIGIKPSRCRMFLQSTQ